jgi:hypothetical protein
MTLMQKIDMKLIIGSKPNVDTMEQIIAAYGHDKGAAMSFTVFELNYKGKTIYVSWSGGEMTPEGPALTLIGKAALESMLNLPFGNDGDLIVLEMRLGPTPLLTKISRFLDTQPDQAKVCLLGDLAKELDGQIAHIFNPVGIRDITN